MSRASSRPFRVLPSPRPGQCPAFCASVCVGISGVIWQHGHLAREMTGAGAYEDGPNSWSPVRGNSSGPGEEKPWEQERGEGQAGKQELWTRTAVFPTPKSSHVSCKGQGRLVTAAGMSGSALRVC